MNDALYVHLRLEAVSGGVPLASEDIAQAAGTALAARVRMLRCEALAVGGGPKHMEAVIRFPASLPLHDLAQSARDAAADAAARAMTLETGRRIAPGDIWRQRCHLKTLSQSDIPNLLCALLAEPSADASRRIPEPHVV